MVGARAPGTEQISQRVSSKKEKMAFFEGCPVGWGGVPTGAGLVDGEVDQDLIPGEGVREGLAWGGKAGWVISGGRGVREAGQGLRGGVQGRASVPGRVSGRGL